MPSVLHITNGDSAGGLIQESDIGGDVLPWRDVLHEGPVPANLDLDQLREVRARYLGSEGLGDFAGILKDFTERDDTLRRFAEYDEIVLWFEWDLYDQLQLIQLLDFFAAFSADDLAETGTSISLVGPGGYLGALPVEEFPVLMDGRESVSKEMLELGRTAWAAFRNSDPREIHVVRKGDTSALRFLGDAFARHLQEFPSMSNGLSRSETQILEAVSQSPQTFTEIFKGVSNTEDRVFCGDSILAGYIQRMSNCETPLIVYPSGERIDAPRADEDSRAFRNAEIVLTDAGRRVLACENDWISMGGSDRWLGGVHLAGRAATWRWDSDAGTLREIRLDDNE
ncbi:MAG: DUF1835 domain-containing protein [Gemmatimonadales bacterium]